MLCRGGDRRRPAADRAANAPRRGVPLPQGDGGRLPRHAPGPAGGGVGGLRRLPTPARPRRRPARSRPTITAAFVADGPVRRTGAARSCRRDRGGGIFTKRRRAAGRGVRLALPRRRGSPFGGACPGRPPRPRIPRCPGRRSAAGRGVRRAAPRRGDRPRRAVRRSGEPGRGRPLARRPRPPRDPRRGGPGCGRRRSATTRPIGGASSRVRRRGRPNRESHGTRTGDRRRGLRPRPLAGVPHALRPHRRGGLPVGGGPRPIGPAVRGAAGRTAALGRPRSRGVRVVRAADGGGRGALDRFSRRAVPGFHRGRHRRNRGATPSPGSPPTPSIGSGGNGTNPARSHWRKGRRTDCG